MAMMTTTCLYFIAVSFLVICSKGIPFHNGASPHHFYSVQPYYQLPLYPTEQQFSTRMGPNDGLADILEPIMKYIKKIGDLANFVTSLSPGHKNEALQRGLPSDELSNNSSASRFRDVLKFIQGLIYAIGHPIVTIKAIINLPAQHQKATSV